MKLVNQHTKNIMEGCKDRAQDAGLQFDQESLEYIVTNSDLIELQPKIMIPTMYDFWVNDIEIIQGKEIYKVFPHNPYETVINSRPAISFYNDNKHKFDINNNLDVVEKDPIIEIDPTSDKIRSKDEKIISSDSKSDKYLIAFWYSPMLRYEIPA